MLLILDVGMSCVDDRIFLKGYNEIVPAYGSWGCVFC